MSKRMKFFAGLLTAGLMMGSMVMPASAGMVDANGIPKTGDYGKITVQGVSKDDTVKIYRYAEAKYNTSSGLWEGYDKKVNISSFEDGKITANDLKALVAWAGLTTTTAIDSKVSTGSDVVFESTLIVPGSYLVLVTAADGSMTVYNPMVASTYYTDGTTGTMLQPGAVNADGNMSSAVIKNAVEYAKSSDLTYDKTAIAISNDGGGEGANDADAAVGDIIEYKITGQIPSYSSDEYGTVTYQFNDTMSKGLTYVGELQVTVGGTPVGAKPVQGGVYTATSSKNDSTKETTLTITFDSDYLKTLALNTVNKEVVVTYKARINEDAITDAEPNGRADNDVDSVTNTVNLTFTQNPGDDKTTPDKDVTTYTYNLDNEITKVDQDGAALKDAEFGLFKNAECTGTAYKTVKTVVEGEGTAAKAYIHFEGLDEGTYYLKETAAPSGFQINTNVYTVVIAGAKDSQGNATGSRTVTISSSGNDIKDAATLEVKNSKLSALPSTGGIGTYLFTIIGVAVMATMAFFFFGGRKTEEE